MLDFLGENYFNLDEKVLLCLLLNNPNLAVSKQVSKLLHLTQKSCSKRVFKIKQVIRIYVKLEQLNRLALADELLMNYMKEELKLLFFIETRKDRKVIAKSLKIAFSTVAQRFEKISQKAEDLQLIETRKYLTLLKELFYLRRYRKNLTRICIL